MSAERLALRLAGLGVLVVALVLYEPGATGALQRLTLPLAMAFAAWALTRNVAAVALGGTLLAAIHSDLSAADPYAAYAYPALAAAGAVTLVVSWSRRFRARILATHEARWSARRAAPPGETDPEHAES